MQRNRIVALITTAGMFPAVVTFAVATSAPISDYNDVIRIVNNAANWLFGILLALAVIFVILAAFRFLNAAGDPKAVETAKQQIIYALIAVVVAVLSKTLVNAIAPILGKLST